MSSDYAVRMPLPLGAKKISTHSGVIIVAVKFNQPGEQTIVGADIRGAIGRLRAVVGGELT